ncbi:ArgP/LysG family DNA-binding transcriptional regulator [Nocardioides albus]|uniref:LysR family transcriptional regulator (Chromosome initiation inhibitor) n=1 Tax=Nocardioides albus TaxID=1841 RepID=A0A7W5A6Y8_9ACTN|nr:ArgP/LysG family DNA-binding transcriptional regulator [Nocardioides albus]MBB3090615.1 LysR family transcriptional regulator (chromosome initiation inhibitor) [Nocardioides albus]GGU25185.1 lysine export transcriptional regulatory protein LysG [Nocardioides albus]
MPSLDPTQLETLVVIAEEGTFDAAARRLHITPSAVSQRIRALERAAGQVLVRRTTPCTPTEAGEPLIRQGRQLRLLLAEAAASLNAGGDSSDGAVVDLSVVVNADTLATWFRPVLDEVATWDRTALRITVEDQGYSADALRRGEVLAAVTSEPKPVQGCTVEPLGRLRYTPGAAPALIERHRRGRGIDWGSMPMIVFNEKDHLQDEVLAAHGATRPPVVHRVPSSHDFHEAIRRGLGWGMLLDAQAAADLESGTTIPLPGAKPIDIELFWQRWRLDSVALDDLSEAVRRAARAQLRRPRGQRAGQRTDQPRPPG